MPKTMSDEAYYAQLPRKRVASGVIFLRDHLMLIVKPDYKPDWLLPGGSVDANESPLACAIREVREELGLELKGLRLLQIDYDLPEEGFKGDAFHFTFLGPELTDEEARSIRLQTSELIEAKWLPKHEATALLNPRLRTRTQTALQAFEENRGVTYRENGVIIANAT